MQKTDEQQGRAIDWEGMYRRLETVGQELARGFTPPPGEKKRLLKQRAQKLAREQVREERTGEALEVVEFLLAFERYAFASSFIREVYRLRDLTPLPGTPPFVAGIVNVRGRIISAIDLKKFFDLPEKGLGDFNKLIILMSEDRELGILTDAIVGNRTVHPEDLQPSLPTLTGIREEYLQGIAGGRLVVLDAKKILQDRRLVVEDQV